VIICLLQATKPKTINVDVDDFFSFNSRPSFEAKKQQYQPSPKAISVANPLLSLTKRPVDSTESDSDTDASTDSRQRNHSPTHSPLKRARCELTPPPPEMPHVKLFPSQPRPVLYGCCYMLVAYLCLQFHLTGKPFDWNHQKMPNGH
jgi:hypothetical protein